MDTQSKVPPARRERRDVSRARALACWLSLKREREGGGEEREKRLLSIINGSSSAELACVWG